MTQAIQFRRATKEQARLRMALVGPAGSGKTYTALALARELGSPIALIDTERGSASKYSDAFAFDVVELATFEPETYVAAIRAAEQAGYAVLIVDSLSHAWAGKGGVLEFVDTVAKRQGGGGNFSAWREATPKHNLLVDTILGANMHVILTMRSKMEYVQEKDGQGRTTVRKVGLQPIQREGLEYEADVVADIDSEHNMIITKTRCPALTDRVFNRAGADVGAILKGWLTDGAPATEHAKIDGSVVEVRPPAGQTSSTEAPPRTIGARKADPWAGAEEWQLQAREQLAAWGVKFAEIPEIAAYSAPSAKAAMDLFAHDLPEGADPFDSLMALARPIAQQKEQGDDDA